MTIDTRTSTLMESALDTHKLAERISEKIKARMAPPGSLGLPPLLEARRHRYGIPDGAFRVQAAFERVLVWEIEPAEMASMTSGGIILASSTMDRMKGRSPRGVIVSAGAKALDCLRSNGIDLGHVVLTTHYVIGQTPIEYVDGYEFCINIMQAGDITGSEDTAEMLRDGTLGIGWNGHQHVYTWKDGSHAAAPPAIPWTPKSI